MKKPVGTKTNPLALLGHEVSVPILHKKNKCQTVFFFRFKCENHLHVVAALWFIRVCPADQVATVLLLIFL